MIKNLNYNYHDAIRETISLQHTDLLLTISLYPIYYRNQQQVQLMISGITNIINCEKWVSEVISICQEENEASLGARINEIYLDKNNKNQLLVSIDYIKTVKLNFEYFKEILKPTTCS
ncbi:hypothetical protein KO02_13755 [Sphingobacterium sp. ML3W]|uniref:hypothetical protein n=1 Tax=Sphingobacterium sp. ML3W TaxID=1538644 RepID=UPI0004F6B439|nr:hypothetical protein [Sphingobacterium sp. ML3W]AIM37625.1 hypothetical protein KO02_13755 [Sphingobacterium sp. ML3W]